MAYNGEWLLKLGDYIVPHKYIRADSYKAYQNKQVLDPWTDANGYEHYTAVDLKAIKVEFELPDGLTNKEVGDFFAHVRANFYNSRDEKLMITAYVPFIDSYVTQLGYIADVTEIPMRMVVGNTIQYQPIKITLVGGVVE